MNSNKSVTNYYYYYYYYYGVTLQNLSIDYTEDNIANVSCDSFEIYFVLLIKAISVE